MKVFVSHITEEAAVAAVLKGWIEFTFSGTCSVFVSSDRADLPPGSRWSEEIKNALRDAKVLLILCSERSIRRPWINFEAGCAWITGTPIMPICHSGQQVSTLPPPLSDFLALDLTRPAFPEDLINALARHLNVGIVPRLDYPAMQQELRVAVESVSPERSNATESKLTPGDQARSLERQLTRLTPLEYSIFATFVDNESRVETFYISDADSKMAMTAQSLARRGYLDLVARRSNAFYGEEISYGITDPVLAFFRAHPEALASGRKSNERSRTESESNDGTPSA